ncbi:hypothetical protein P9112_008159 [Eukaryota sp. TZLM1-RC]
MNGKQLFLNIIWVIFIGWAFFIEYIVAAFFLAITIIGIPFAYQLVRLGFVALIPFGQRVGTVQDADKDVLTTIFNVLFLIFFFWIPLIHLLFTVVFFLLIFTIPFGIANWRLFKLSLWPFGREIYQEDGTSWT